MAGPQTTRGTQLLIKIETAPGSGVFAHPCLINAKRGIKFTTSTNKVIVPDCDNPDDPAWQTVIKDAISASIDGAGKNDKASVSVYDAWLRSPDGKAVQVWLGTYGYWQGTFQLTNYELSGDRGNVVENTIALESDGVVAPFVVA